MGYNSSPKVRFIPAGAGNTRKSFVYSLPTPVHPRRCGEHRSDFRVFSSANGSSPQVRGTPPIKSCASMGFRFIPAGAGNTGRITKTALGKPVHPRRCGEHSFHKSVLLDAVGSSPQVRGTRLAPAAAHGSVRFIPAGAGNTILKLMQPFVSGVHPRRCGEHRAMTRGMLRNRGSSPQVRGTHAAIADGGIQRRFIPAGAGNTPQAGGLCRAVPVHPRRCGEHSPVSAPPRPAPGSSPQVRGTPFLLATGVLSFRFIPAGAGNTQWR